MSKDWDKQFDASVGLAFSLKAFEMYRKSGTLSAEIRSVPGIRGQCQAYLELIQGKVVSCYLIDRKGERHHATKEALTQLDEGKGPFNWIFRTSNESAIAKPAFEQIFHQPAPQSPIPRPLVSYLNLTQLQQWTPQQQQCLLLIFSMVNGQRSIDEIKAQVSLPPTIVDEGVRILLQLRVIGIQ